MATINTADCTFCVVNREQKNTWANNVDWATCEFVLRQFRKALDWHIANDTGYDASGFEVWVVQDGIVTHMVPFEDFCKAANI